MRSWIFRRDPDFRVKAGRVLDLYVRRFEGKLLHPGEFVISADEKSQLQALGRRHLTVPAGPGRPALCEFEYRRGGTLAYLAAWDVHHARLFDRVEEKTGIEPFGRLVEQVMTTEPYASARRVFWVVDNGCSHAGQASIDRLEGAWENLRLIHLPIHASWLNQIELYVRHEAPCERRERTNDSQPSRLGCRPRADAAARRSWGQPRAWDRAPTVRAAPTT
ncbi:MAG: transposase [Actinomycetota bacterium]|nr:transposase [Actinomycetota bacterium]MDQ3647150.1 transposase [Actinomycetota bacterium]